ncbi:hypothetical protein HDU91_004540, partial [Kappamyces sp. JEL0680]
MSSIATLIIRVAELEANSKKLQSQLLSIRSSLRHVPEKDIDKGLTIEQQLNCHVLQLKQFAEEDLNSSGKDKYGNVRVLS